MFFNSKATIILSRHSFSIIYDGQTSIYNLNGHLFNQGTIKQIFAAALSETKQKKWHIILADDICYIQLLTIPNQQEINFTNLQPLINNHIPEKLTARNWQYRHVGNDQNNKYLQVFVIPEILLSELTTAEQELKIKLYGLHPLSYCYLQFIQQTEEPVGVIAVINNLLSINFFYHDAVIYTQLTNLEKLSTDLADYLSSAQEISNQKISKILVSDPDLVNKISALTPVNIQVKKMMLAKSSALDESVTNDHSTLVINIKPADITKSLVNKPSPEEPKKNRSQLSFRSAKNHLKLLFFILLLVIILFIAAVLIKINQTVKPNHLPPISPLPSLQASPSVEVINSTASAVFDEYLTQKIVIANGSGKAGEAKRAEKFLNQAGFIKTSTQNADRYDYLQTEIITMDTALKTKLIQTLSANYVIASQSSQISTSSAETLIIIGQQQPS